MSENQIKSITDIIKLVALLEFFGSIFAGFILNSQLGNLSIIIAVTGVISSIILYLIAIVSILISKIEKNTAKTHKLLEQLIDGMKRSK
jgi:hypothetical protein